MSVGESGCFLGCCGYIISIKVHRQAADISKTSADQVQKREPLNDPLLEKKCTFKDPLEKLRSHSTVDDIDETEVAQIEPQLSYAEVAFETSIGYSHSVTDVEILPSFGHTLTFDGSLLDAHFDDTQVAQVDSTPHAANICVQENVGCSHSVTDVEVLPSFGHTLTFDGDVSDAHVSDTQSEHAAPQQKTSPDLILPDALAKGLCQAGMRVVGVSASVGLLNSRQEEQNALEARLRALSQQVEEQQRDLLSLRLAEQKQQSRVQELENCRMIEAAKHSGELEYWKAQAAAHVSRSNVDLEAHADRQTPPAKGNQASFPLQRQRLSVGGARTPVMSGARTPVMRAHSADHASLSATSRSLSLGVPIIARQHSSFQPLAAATSTVVKTVGSPSHRRQFGSVNRIASPGSVANQIIAVRCSGNRSPRTPVSISASKQELLSSEPVFSV